MNSPEAPTVTVLLPVTFTYQEDGMLWFMAAAQTPEMREALCLVSARDLFSQCLAWVNGEVDGKPPEHTPEVIVSLPLEVT